MSNQVFTQYNIQRSVMVQGYRAGAFVCPNYTPRNWWECDVLELRKSGFWAEYEIKLSRPDFRADRYKAIRRFNYKTMEYDHFRKHDLIASRSEKAPNLFFYVCPSGLLEASEVPEWAGLIYASFRYYRNEVVRLEQIKPAPRLHRVKFDEKERNHMLRTYYHRFQHWFLFKKEAA